MITKEVDFTPLHEAHRLLNSMDVDGTEALDLAAALTHYALVNAVLAESLPEGNALHYKAAGKAATAVLMLTNPLPACPHYDVPVYAWAGFIGSALAQYELMFSSGFGKHPLNDADSSNPPATVMVTWKELKDL